MARKRTPVDADPQRLEQAAPADAAPLQRAEPIIDPDPQHLEQAPPLRLEYLDAAQLNENPKNWRTHPPEQVDALRAVLSEVGWAGALLYNERTGRLIDGHARRKLAAEQGAPVPVLIGDWSEADEEKILATLDPLSALAVPDAAKLETLLAGVTTTNEALGKMLADLAANAAAASQALVAGLTDPDDIPEPPDEAITQPGDLWILGDHRLLCGDSSKAEDVDRLLGGASIQLVNTDPPYNVKVEPRSNNAIAAGLSSFQGTTQHQGFDVERHPEKSQPTHKKMRAKDRPLLNDFISEDDFDRLLNAWFGNLTRVLLPGRGFYIWGGYANIANYPAVLKAHDLYMSQTIIWDKQWPVLTRKDFMGAHEWCFYGWKLGAAHQFFGPNNATDLWAIKKVTPMGMVHLTEKPVELATRAMEYSSKPGENVLDLFGGSGSTLIGAERTGRKAFLMELDPAYCDVIVQRYEQFSGKKAERRPQAPAEEANRSPTVAQGGPEA